MLTLSRHADDAVAVFVIDPGWRAPAFAAPDHMLFAAIENARAKPERHGGRHLLQPLRDPVRLATGEIHRVIDGPLRRRHHSDLPRRRMNLYDQPPRPRVELHRHRHRPAVDPEQLALGELGPLRLGRDSFPHGLFFTYRACFSRTQTSQTCHARPPT